MTDWESRMRKRGPGGAWTPLFALCSGDAPGQTRLHLSLAQRNELVFIVLC